MHLAIVNPSFKVLDVSRAANNRFFLAMGLGGVEDTNV